ncbi:hypothetical protein Anas_01044 [Armadillidium nasatum]|uniref:Uncharacterized protein n=1 Tax=Armadillidium nasatum TaxID=96803 RepID=A0A5N5SJ50_9CRUS|nr:hypothetical protein Anas_01044 [Armadillidium nasatum]
MTSYCSENSIESLKEESDTGESLLSYADDSNMPSVKELAYKFDSLKDSKSKSTEVRKHHENLRPSRNRNVPTSPSYNNNNNNNNVSRKYNDRVIVNEVRIGGKPTKIYGKNINTDYPRLPYRFEGFREIGSEGNKEVNLNLPEEPKPLTPSSSSDVFTPTEKVSNHFTFEDHKYRNRFSTSELNKADEFWGSYGSSNLQKMKTLNVSNSSSIAESDISIATLPAIPDSTSRDINDLFGIKLRINDKNRHVSGSSSDIFPISKIKRPKSMPDFRIIKDLSDDESDSMNKHDPVIARTHNLPKFHANITKKEEKSYKTSISISLHNIGANKEPLKYEGKNYNSSTNFGTFTRDRKSGNRMYDFIRKYENKKSLNEVHSYVHHDEPKSEDKNVTTPVEYDEEKQIKQATDVSFSVPLKPKFKKRGSMQDFLKMYSNKTTLPPISNKEEIEVIPQVIINNSVENLNNSFDFSTKENQEDSVDLNVSESNEKKITYTSEVSMQVIDNKDSKESNTSGLTKNCENVPTSEDSNAKTTEIGPTNKSEPNSPQVETFVYGSTNKPKIKPKPDFLYSSKNSIEEETVDNSTKEINSSDRLLENSVDIKPDYNKEKYKFKVSKFQYPA